MNGPRDGARMEERLKRGICTAGLPEQGTSSKMIYNGIGMVLMQTYAEGFESVVMLTRKSLPADMRYDLNLHGYR